MRISQNNSDISGLVWCVAARRDQIADALWIASTFDIIGSDRARPIQFADGDEKPSQRHPVTGNAIEVEPGVGKEQGDSGDQCIEGKEGCDNKPGVRLSQIKPQCPIDALGKPSPCQGKG